MSATRPLSALASIISSSAKEIEEKYSSHGAAVPSLDEAFSPPTFDAEEIMLASARLITAANQLLAMVKPAHVGLVEASLGMHTTAMLSVVTEKPIAEILREAGPQGLHTRDIGAKVNMDPRKIGRVLRFLASQHIFREIAPDVFTNNRLSSLLDTGKAVDDLLKDPMVAFDSPKGFSPFIGHIADEMFRGSSRVRELITDPATAFSQEAKPTALNLAFNNDAGLFEWFETPENSKRLKRFTQSMAIATGLFADSCNKVIDWKSMKDGATVVDVGGGVGQAMLPLAKEFPHLKYIVQDRAPVIAQAGMFWSQQFPSAVAEGKVKLMAHDFFEPNPVTNADVFFMRFVLHDWSDLYARKILTNLAAAAQPHTKLLVVEQVLPYLCPVGDQFDHIPGAKAAVPPEPLVVEPGSEVVYKFDIHMMCINAQERTVGTWIEVVEGTGWKLESVNRSLGQASIGCFIFTRTA